MKGFTKDGKFRPTENRKKSSLKKSDVRKKIEIVDMTKEPLVKKSDGTYELSANDKKKMDAFFSGKRQPTLPRNKQSLDTKDDVTAEVNYSRGLLTNELNHFEELKEIREGNRENKKNMEKEIDIIVKDLSHLATQIGANESDGRISQAEVNVAKGELTNLLNNYEDFREVRNSEIENEKEVNKMIHASIVDMSKLIHGIGVKN